MEEKFELYKIRTLGERFSATSDFVRENWQVLLKNILPIGIPLTLLMGFFMQYYVQGVFAMVGNPTVFTPMNWMAYAGLMAVSIVFSLFIYAMPGALLNKYAEGSLTPETGWEDLKDTFFSIAGKLLLQYLIICLGCILLSVLILIPAILLASGNFLVIMSVFFMLFTLVFIAVVVFLIPMFTLMRYPVFFEPVSVWESIKKAFQWGFRYWGSTFLSSLLGGLILVLVFYILAMPYLIYLIFSMGTFGWIGYLLALLMYAAILLMTPLLVIFLAFQYTSIAEREKSRNTPLVED
ncbi:hypothetical protein FACS1894182_05120 [Bacteroidia bacterium]|nr:hypothetical protein FACS1894182_05120 [Bacteroidia bacterium]